MFFFLFYFFEIMNLIKLSNNKFTKKYISNQYIPYTNYKNNISFLQCPKDNPPYIYFIIMIVQVYLILQNHFINHLNRFHKVLAKLLLMAMHIM